MKWSLQNILIHILCWLAFLLLPIIASPDFSTFSAWEISIPGIRHFISSLLLIPFFYANYYLFIPEFYHKKKYIVFAAVTLLCFAFISILPALLTPDFGEFPRNPMPGMQSPMMPPPMEMQHINPPMPAPHHNLLIPQFESNLLKFLIIFFISMLLRIRELWKKSQNEQKAVELSYLKLQVNPHFLFNTLNSIYSLALEKSDKTPSAIVKLSELMRYVTSEVNEDFVPLSKEVNYISNYIELQRIRLGDTADIEFCITGDTDRYKIAPLILIPFIENAFKFGVNPEEPSLIKIDLIINDNRLVLKVNNRKVRLDHDVKSNGMGLKNVKQRLGLIYPNTHTLSISDSNRDFAVELTLQLI